VHVEPESVDDWEILVSIVMYNSTVTVIQKLVMCNYITLVAHIQYVTNAKMVMLML